LIAIMVSMVVLQILTAVRRSPDATAADDLITRHWSTVLLHLADEDDTDLLFDLVRDRLGRLVTAQVHDAARRQGGRTDDVTVVDPLVCLASGITTDAVRRRLASAAGVLVPFGQDSELMLLMADTRADDDEERPAFHVPFLRPFTAAVAAVLLLLPLVMTGPERAACRSAGCASALTTYGRALHWLSFQFIWQDVPGLRPSSDLFVYGFSVHFLLPTTVLVGIRATRRLAMEHRAALRRVQRAKDKAMGRTRVMIMTVNSGERDAVLSAAKEFTQEPAWRNFTANLTVYELGVINETRVSVVQAGEQGTTTPAGAPMSTASAIRHLAPDYAIITGICYGLQPHDQAMGDVLVSQRIRDLDLGGLKDDGTGVVERGRGENLQPSHVLLNRCQAAQSDWDGTAVHFGEMLAWNKLVNSERTVLRLRDEYPTAIGGEMEGAGFNSAARRAGVDWILVKGISDWGYGKTSDHQPAAAGNAARFVLHMIAIGALRTRPADLHG
jgi:nucleoside phosphorylase